MASKLGVFLLGEQK